MSDTSEALRRLMTQIGAKVDVLVGGTPVQARQLMAEAAAALAVEGTVVSIASPIGELSLSTLMAQLSGRLDFDDQDDAVLELGFKRLNGDGQTVLMVLAPTGISRSALRYLQHVSRHAPRLVMVVYLAPSLAPMLEEPGFVALRARLSAAPAIGFDAPAPAAIAPAVAVPPPVVEPIVPNQAAPEAAKSRRPMLWLASALSAAAMAGVVWAVHNAPGTAVAGSRTAHADLPLVPASVPIPALAGSSDPVVATLSSPEPAVVAPSAAARPSGAVLAMLPPQPPSMPLPHPEAGVAGPVQPPAKATLRRPDAPRREPTRYARARPYWPAPRYQEPAEYDGPPAWDGVSPIWVRRDPRRGESPYLGTYAVGPNGVRVFQYDP